MSEIDRFLNKCLQIATASVFVLLVLDVLLGVLTRYVFGNQLRWTEELATFLLVWLTFLGAALAYRDNAHLGVDVLTSQFEAAVKRWSRVSIAFIVFILSVGLFLVGGISLFIDRWEAGQQMSTLGIRRAWLYLAVPVSGFLFSFFSMHQFLQELNRVEKKEVKL